MNVLYDSDDPVKAHDAADLSARFSEFMKTPAGEEMNLQLGKRADALRNRNAPLAGVVYDIPEFDWSCSARAYPW